ncbi:MAG: YnbE family lipoprotein [Erythrobacter sp.]
MNISNNRNWAIGIAMGLAAALSGCINLTAPTDPIVITLNINIEVLARLADDASETIDENADIF